MYKNSIRQWLWNHTHKTLTFIPDGKRGEISKITEEYLELKDAIEQNHTKLSFIEACDLIDVSLAFQWKQFKVPTILIVLLIYLRRIYKPIRDKTYYSMGLYKEDFNRGITNENTNRIY